MSASQNAAQDLSQFLGTVKEKVDSYNAERKQLAQSLQEIVRQAQQLLSELGEPVGAGLAAVPPAGRRRGRPPRSGRKRGRAAKAAGVGKRRGKRKMSAETRKKMAEAAKKRWAAKRKSEADSE